MPKPKYPHMRIWEETIMDRFHDMHILEGKWSYDVHLQVRKPDIPEYQSENERKMWLTNIAKKADAVCETPVEIYVIEVKTFLRPSAVGQALTYKTLYKEQFKPTKPVIPAIIASVGNPDMQHVCDVYNIKTWVI